MIIISHVFLQHNAYRFFQTDFAGMIGFPRILLRRSTLLVHLWAHSVRPFLRSNHKTCPLPVIAFGYTMSLQVLKTIPFLSAVFHKEMPIVPD